MSDDPDEIPLIKLFRMEAEGILATLNEGLLALENAEPDAARLEAMMRAAHSIKGAARIVGLSPAVEVAHALEDCFVAAQKGRITLGAGLVDPLFAAVDLLERISRLEEAEVDGWAEANGGNITACVAGLAALMSGAPQAPLSGAAVPAQTVSMPDVSSPVVAADSEDDTGEEDRVLRVTAESLGRLLGLAGESMVESNRLAGFGRDLLRLRRGQRELGKLLDRLREHPGLAADEATASLLRDAQSRLGENERLLREHIGEMDRFERAGTSISRRLYREARAVRMRPFADGVRPYARMVRDLARELGKEARLVVTGERTRVDRDILARLDAPLTHLLRNALDHGLESPAARLASGKSAGGVLRLDARHRAGRLIVTVEDDGAGVPVETVRAAVVARGLADEETASAMSQEEVLEFLFLPGFSMKHEVTEVSGRGVGLDIVRNLAKELRGTARVSTKPGRGTRFELQLPITLSVMRALLVEIAGDPYALPLAGVAKVLRVAPEDVATTEGRAHFELGGERVGLVSARQVLELPGLEETVGARAVVVIGEAGARHGLAVDALRGELELVVRPLDSRLGKVQDVAAAAVLPDGEPVLILDLEDMARSIERLAAGGGLARWTRAEDVRASVRRRRVLVVDDSLTVRELERKLLRSRGYDVEIAVDGMEGWNAARRGEFDLVITDVDMPRMDGIALVSALKADPRLAATPVMIVSYKDREEDRRRGLEAGADYYLTKGAFQDDGLLDAVADLIGPAEVTAGNP